MNSVTHRPCLALQEGSDAEECGLDEEWPASPSPHQGPSRATPRRNSRWASPVWLSACPVSCTLSCQPASRAARSMWGTLCGAGVHEHWPFLEAEEMYFVMLARRQRTSEPHASGAPLVGQSLWASACVGVIRPVIRETQSMLPKCRPVLAGNVARALLRSAQRVAGPVAASGMMCMGNSDKKLFQFQELRQEEAAVSFNPSCSACPRWLLLQESGCTHVSNSFACWHAVMRGHCLKYQTHSEQDPQMVLLLQEPGSQQGPQVPAQPPPCSP